MVTLDATAFYRLCSGMHTCGMGAYAPAALCSSCAQHNERSVNLM
jgi:hypothetical protein